MTLTLAEKNLDGHVVVNHIYGNIFWPVPHLLITKDANTPIFLNYTSPHNSQNSEYTKVTHERLLMRDSVSFPLLTPLL